MWHQFTERARHVIFFAQEEARRMGESYMGTEHLLLGLVRENDNAAMQVLDRVGVSVAQVRAETRRQVARGDCQLTPGIQLAPRTKYVIDLALREARELKNSYVGTEHLLLGLLREGEGLAGRVLHSLGADLEQTRREVTAFQAERIAVDGDPEPGTAASSSE